MNADFCDRLRRGEPLVGTLATLGFSEVTEILSGCGFDWIFIDLEHSPIDLAACQRMIQAMRSDCASLVRVPWNDAVWIKRVLDIGCDGVIVPQIRTAEEAKRAVRACKYPPDGDRSVGLARAHGYGITFKDYVATANDDIAVVLQIEHAEGVANIEAILDVPGVDALFVGPYDLSGSLDLLGEVEHVRVKEAIAEVEAASKRRHKPLGIFTMDGEAAARYRERGFSLLAVGIDSACLVQAARRLVEQTRGPRRPESR